MTDVKARAPRRDLCQMACAARGLAAAFLAVLAIPTPAAAQPSGGSAAQPSGRYALGASVTATSAYDDNIYFVERGGERASPCACARQRMRGYWPRPLCRSAPTTH